MKKKHSILGLCIMTGILVYIVYASQIPRVLRVSFLDVGQGDAIFIQSPTGVQVLIDGGATKQVLEKLHNVMPLFDRSIDIVIATHPDTDHIGGLTDVVERFSIGLFIDPGARNESGVQDILNEKIAERNILYRLAQRGDTYDLGGGAQLTILFPFADVSKEESNSGSIVARLTYGSSSFLFTGDAPAQTEYILAAIDGKNIESDVLKLGHHGSNTSSSEVFLQAVKPKWSIVSAGKKNTYGHPNEEVVERVLKFKSEILDTRTSGTIIFETNGEMIEVLP